jgi:uncharacterized OB-fold protein
VGAACTADLDERLRPRVDLVVRRLAPPLLPPFHALAPYVVIAVALDEDPCVRLIGNLVTRAGDPSNPIGADTVRIGARVRAVFERIDDGITPPRWVLE